MREPEDFKTLEKRNVELSALIIGLYLILAVFIIITCFYIQPAGAVTDEYTNNVLLVGFTGLSLLFCAHIVFEKLKVKHLRALLISAEAEKNRILEGAHAELKVSKNELEKKVKELEIFHDVAIDREFRMKEMEEEMEKLKKELKKK